MGGRAGLGTRAPVFRTATTLVVSTDAPHDPVRHLGISEPELVGEEPIPPNSG
jgi:hypothetical protein